MPNPTKWHVRPAKTQNRPVWSESSLSTWKKLGSIATHWVLREDSDQTGRMPRLLSCAITSCSDTCTVVTVFISCHLTFLHSVCLCLCLVLHGRFNTIIYFIARECFCFILWKLYMTIFWIRFLKEKEAILKGDAYDKRRGVQLLDLVGYRKYSRE